MILENDTLFPQLLEKEGQSYFLLTNVREQTGRVSFSKIEGEHYHFAKL